MDHHLLLWRGNEHGDFATSAAAATRKRRKRGRRRAVHSRWRDARRRRDFSRWCGGRHASRRRRDCVSVRRPSDHFIHCSLFVLDESWTVRGEKLHKVICTYTLRMVVCMWYRIVSYGTIHNRVWYHTILIVRAQSSSTEFLTWSIALLLCCVNISCWCVFNKADVTF